MIEIDHLSKTYHHRSWQQLLLGRPARQVAAVQNLSLSIAGGEVLGLLGPNGAGKTTLLKMMASLVTPDAGQIRLDGREITGGANWVKRRVGLVSGNERSFYWRLTGRQNLEFFARLYGMSGRPLQQQLTELLALAGLEDKADLPFSGWSTGQRQRLAIARALLGKPDVLLLDEPTAGLDPEASRRLLTLTRELLRQPGRLLIWCSHDLTEVEQVSDKVAILRQGKLVYHGLPSGLATASGRCRVELGPSGEEPLQRLPWGWSRLKQNDRRLHLEFDVAETDIPELLKALQDAGIKVYACQPQRPNLEELYIRLASEGATS